MEHVRNSTVRFSQAADHLIDMGAQVMALISRATLDRAPPRVGFPEIGITDSVALRLALGLAVCLTLLLAAS